MKTLGDSTTVYIFDGDKVIAEYQRTTLSKEYIYLGNQQLAGYLYGTLSYYLPDRLSNRAVTDTNGNAVGQQGNYPFGESWYGSGTTTEWQFTSYERDSESGLDNAMFRYNSSRQGRFMQPDPYNFGANPANPQSWNAYAYVLNNPLSLTDPSGKNPGLASDCQAEYQNCGSADGGEAEIVAGGNGGGGVSFGCDEFDLIDSTSYCSTTVLPIMNGTYSPFQYQYTGPASDWQTVTFDTWDQYANWRTTVAAGAPDPCVFTQFNNGQYTTGSVDYTVSQSGCQSAGGQWVVPGFDFIVNSNTGVVTGLPPSAPMHPNGTYSAYLGCVGGQWLDHTEEWLTATVAPAFFLWNRQPVKAVVALGVEASVNFALAGEIRHTCSSEVYGGP